MAKGEIVHLLVSREKVNELIKGKIEKCPAEELVRKWQWTWAESHILSAKTLISQVGKERAKEITKKVLFDYFYERGRTAAEKLGNPKDLDSYLEAYFFKEMESIPVVPPIEVLERTKDKCVFGVKQCFWVDAINSIMDASPDLVDSEIMEVLKVRCIHDEAWAIGFNPKIRFGKVKFLLDGDDGCYFECQVQ